MSYVPLAQITLTGADAEIIFGNIPNTFRDLVLVFNGSTTTSLRGLNMRVNADSGNNYSWVRALGFAATNTNSASGASENNYTIGSSAGVSTTPYMATVQLMDYSVTDKHKSFLSRANRPDEHLDMRAGRWANTNAINSITIYTDGLFSIGTTLTLHGIAG
jgi:hypothetical protein